MDCNYPLGTTFSAVKKTLKAKSAFTLLAALLVSGNIFSQLIVRTDTLQANFGVDGGVYANKYESAESPPSPAYGTVSDDWFRDTTGAGMGVIDTTGAAALRTYLQATNANISFTRGMSRPNLSVNNGYLWLDARYIRDNKSDGNNKDTSTFTSGADKNSDNPCSWTLGIKDVPQKTDIIDVYAHARRNGPSPNNDLWLFLG